MTYTPFVDGETPVADALNQRLDEIYDSINNVPVSQPPGSIQMWSSSTPPTGWLSMDGSAISRTTYSKLFSVIGTSFGVGNGTTTFNIPDARGRAIIGNGVVSNGEGLNALFGQSIGEEGHQLTISEYPSHIHQLGGFTDDTTGGNLNMSGAAAVFLRDASATFTGQPTTSTDAAHENMQPFIASYWIVKF